MEIRLSLTLPRDSLSVSIARRVLTGALRVLGVEESQLTDIEAAVTEAVTNVLDHAQTTDVYEVSAGVRGTTCVIEVIDHGGGFDSSMQGLADADAGAESGRGVQLMRALVDRVDFINHPQDGNVVHLEKELRCVEGSTLERLGLPPPQQGPTAQEDHGMDRAEPA